MADRRTQISLKAAGLVLLAGAALGGCQAARGVAEMTDFATTPGEPKPFVVETRPQDPRYIPIGTTVTRQAKRMGQKQPRIGRRIGQAGPGQPGNARAQGIGGGGGGDNGRGHRDQPPCAASRSA